MSVFASIILIGILALMLMTYLNNKQKNRREARREELQERREKYLEDLLRSKKEVDDKPEDLEGVK